MTYHVARLGRETAPNLFFGRTGIIGQGEANTATVDRMTSTYGDRSHGAFAGPVIRPMMVAPDVDVAAKKLVFPRWRLSGWDTFPDNFYKGASLRAYRFAAGKLVLAGETTVVSGSHRFVLEQTPGGQAMPAGVGTYRWSRDGWNQPGMVRHFAVAAVDGTGKRGPWSPVVSHTFGTGNPVANRTSGFVPSPFKWYGPIPEKNDPGEQIDPAIGTPQNVRVTGLDNNNTVQIDFDGVPGLTHVIGYSNHPEFVNDEHLILADVSFIQKGDLLILSKRYDHTLPKADVLSPRPWASGLASRFGTDLLRIYFNDDVQGTGRSFEFRTDADGSPYVRVTIPAGYTQSIQDVTHSGTGQTWYPVFVPGTVKRLTVEARAVGTAVDSTKARLSMQNVGPVQPRALPTTWTTLTGDFTVPEPIFSDNLPRVSALEVTGPAVVDVRMIAVTDSNVDPYGLHPDIEQLMVDSGSKWVRHHALIKTNGNTYGIDDLLRRLGPVSRGGDSLFRFFEAVQRANLKIANPARHLSPWWQVEGHGTVAEYKRMAGSIYTVYNANAVQDDYQIGAKMRVDAGQVAPWITVFPGMMGEIGNENWNPVGAFYTLPAIATASPGTLNGALLDYIAEIFMAAPGYDAAKSKWYLGGWSINDTWNRDSILASRHADYIGHADYNGGWDSGLTAALSPDDPVGMFTTLANNNIKQGGETRGVRMSKFVALCASLSQGRAKPIRAMHYEAGPGYVLSGLNGATVTKEQAAAQELLMKSVAAGTATLDAFLLNQALGVVSSNFFTLTRGDRWTAAARLERGGAYNPPFQWTAFANRELAGGVRQLDPQTALPLVAPDGAAAGRAVQVYQVTRPDGRIGYAIINVDPQNSHPVKLRLKSTRRWMRHAMTGDLKTTNTQLETKDNITIQAEMMPAGWGGAEVSVTIPPGKAEVYIEEAA